ncbi:hypothetical protein C8R45DRAFT_982985 [Mycena sanguinolenta]|nr:hypothetical protein C8R45DRAFT_982985 [Mycena sanguinolenta]
MEPPTPVPSTSSGPNPALPAPVKRTGRDLQRSHLMKEYYQHTPKPSAKQYQELLAEIHKLGPGNSEYKLASLRQWFASQNSKANRQNVEVKRNPLYPSITPEIHELLTKLFECTPPDIRKRAYGFWPTSASFEGATPEDIRAWIQERDPSAAESTFASASTSASTSAPSAPSASTSTSAPAASTSTSAPSASTSTFAPSASASAFAPSASTSMTARQRLPRIDTDTDIDASDYASGLPTPSDTTSPEPYPPPTSASSTASASASGFSASGVERSTSASARYHPYHPPTPSPSRASSLFYKSEPANSPLMARLASLPFSPLASFSPLTSPDQPGSPSLPPSASMSNSPLISTRGSLPPASASFYMPTPPPTTYNPAFCSASTSRAAEMFPTPPPSASIPSKLSIPTPASPIPPPPSPSPPPSAPNFATTIFLAIQAEMEKPDPIDAKVPTNYAELQELLAPYEEQMLKILNSLKNYDTSCRFLVHHKTDENA